MNKIACWLIALPGLICVSQPGLGQTAEATPPTQVQPADQSSPGGKRVREFQGDDLGQVLRLLARQAKISLMIDDAIKSNVNVRLENSSAMEAIEAIVHSYKLSMTQDEKGIYYLSPPNPNAETLDFLTRPETANRIAAYKYRLYSALRQQGFNPDEALKIVITSNPYELVPALLGKAEKPAPK